MFRDSSPNSDDRGQALTLDAIIMAAALIFGLVTAAQIMVGNTTTTVADDLTEQQVQQDASDLLEVSNATGDLKSAITYWDDSAGRWVDSGSKGFYTTSPGGHPLEVPLKDVFGENDISYNIDVVYQNPDGTSDTYRMYYQGTPGAHAVSASFTTIVYDDTNLSGPDSSETLSSSSTYFAPDAFPYSQKYNILEVRIIAWKA